MRSFYIFLNLFLFLLAALLFAVNISFKKQLPDKILSTAPVLNETAQSANKTKSGREEIPDIASLWENNLFSPYRSGEGGSLLGPARPTGLELLGICSFDKVSGAIILDKQASAATQPSRLRNRSVSAPGGASARAPGFYKLGEQLDNGFTLSEINADSIVLSRGREQIVLKLEFESEGSISRNTSAAEAASAAAASAALKTAQKPQQNVQEESSENPEAPAVPVTPGTRAAPTPGARPVPASAVSGATGAPGVVVAPVAQPRLQPPQPRRSRSTPEPVNAE